jgi:MSHA biogenesis protein MshI
MILTSVVHSLTRLFRPGTSAGKVCLEIRADGIAWASAPGLPGQKAGFAECMPAQRSATLTGLVSEQGWRKVPVTLVLPMDQYQVFQVDRPEGVDDTELADALKWKLKDFLDFSPSDAVSDVFEFPEDASRGRRPLVNLVAARKSLVQELINLVHDAGMELERIDIAELALRNFAAALDSAGRGVTLVHLRNRYGQMVICRGETLYLSRRLELSYDDLQDAGRQDSAVESLALEIQRSLDYFESQLGQVPPSGIRLVAKDAVLPLSSMLASSLGSAVETPDWSEFAMSSDLDSRCLLAWSAGLPSGRSGT